MHSSAAMLALCTEAGYATAPEAARCGAATRSLARRAGERGDWALAAECWEAALRINPLHPEGWFALGYAALKLNADERALQAFSRVTQQAGHHARGFRVPRQRQRLCWPHNARQRLCAQHSPDSRAGRLQPA